MKHRHRHTYIGLTLAALGLWFTFAANPSLQTVISNNAADLANHIIMVADSTTPRTVSNTFTFSGAQTFSGLATFNRGGVLTPFAVGNAGAGTVTNLDADLLDAQQGSFYTNASNLSTGTLAVARGGTGLGSGTSGGILAFTASGTLASSAALGSTQIVLGGGAGVVPATDSNWTINSQHYLNSATQPRSVAYNNATQSVNNNSATALTFNSEDIDVGTMHDTGSNTSRITIPTGGDGLYWVRGASYFAANATGQRLLRLKKNGTTDVREIEATPAAALQTATEVSALLSLVATDYVELIAFQSSGGSLNLGSATRSQSSELVAVKIW